MSTRSATGDIRLTITAAIANLLDDGNIQASASISESSNVSFSDGVQSGEINRAIKIEGTISSGGSDTIALDAGFAEDIGAGTGKDAVGIDWDALEVAMIFLKNKATSDGRLDVTDGANNNWIGQHSGAGDGLEPDSFVLKCSKGEGLETGGQVDIAMAAVGGDVNFTLICFARDDTDDSSSSSDSSST